MTLKKLRDLDFELWRALTKLYIDDPLQHFYLIYDLTYQLDRIDVLFDVEDRRVRSYLLVWLGTPFASFMVWGFSEEVVEAAVEGAAKCGMPCIVQVQLGEPLTLALDLLKRRGLKFNVKRYLDMAVDGESFKPYSPERAIP
ncbi:MAG: hypothetical protein DRJ62_05840 [Thermoprotei archaeon]|nr:MAG: hypothetical protein DRJ62_05840 [Thermoprotei archaeon]